MGRVFISHSAKEPEASEALQELSAGLNAAGLTVLMDRERLQPGMEWRQEIHTWMALCHAAVVLFSPSALRSDWVRKEAAIVAWRRSLDHTFVLIPVLVPPTKRSDLEANGFGPLALDEIQFSPSVALDQVVARLARLKGTDPWTPMQEWVKRLSIRLRKIEADDREVIDQAASAAGYDLPWDPTLSASDLLARRLLHADVDQIRKAITTLAAVLGRSNKELSEIVEALVPVWVDPLAVAAVPEVVSRPEPPRAIVVNAADNWVAEMYVQRAGCVAPEWWVFESNNVDGEDEDQQVERIVREILEDGRNELKLPSAATPDRVLKRAEEWSREGARFFAVIPSGTSLSERQVALLQERLTSFTLVLLTGADSRASVVKASKAVVLEPQLTEARLQRVSSWIDRLRSLASGAA